MTRPKGIGRATAPDKDQTMKTDSFLFAGALLAIGVLFYKAQSSNTKQGGNGYQAWADTPGPVLPQYNPATGKIEIMPLPQYNTVSPITAYGNSPVVSY